MRKYGGLLESTEVILIFILAFVICARMIWGHLSATKKGTWPMLGYIPVLVALPMFITVVVDKFGSDYFLFKSFYALEEMVAGRSLLGVDALALVTLQVGTATVIWWLSFLGLTLCKREFQTWSHPRLTL